MVLECQISIYDNYVLGFVAKSWTVVLIIFQFFYDYRWKNQGIIFQFITKLK